MPYITAPNRKKEGLIQELADFVRSYGHLADVCNSALKGYRKDYLCLFLRQYDPSVSHKKSKSALIDHFVSLNMSQEQLRSDAPCLAIVPYVADCGVRTADCLGQIVDFSKTSRKMLKMKKKMIKRWIKGGRLIRRTTLSKAIVAELRVCLRSDRWRQWTVTSLRDHVSSVVGSSLHTGHARVFFHKKLQQLLPKKRLKKKMMVIACKEYALPSARFTCIADPVQWRELLAMRRHDYRL